jgi:hypothetical protein
VALINDHEIEELWRDSLAIDHREWFAFPVGSLGRVLILGGFVEIAALENGIHPLDSADADLGVLRDVPRGEALNGVKFGELAIIVGRSVGEKFLLGLLRKVAGVNQK